MSETKRQRIIETAMRLFNENGFHSTPTAKIAKKAKVSVGTLFNYFPTKEDLIEAIYIHIKYHSKAMFLEQLETKPDTHDNMLSMWHSIVVWGLQNPEEFKYLELFVHSPLKSSYQTDQSLEVYQQFQDEILKKIVPTTVCMEDPEFVLNYVDNSLHAAIRYLIQHNVDDQETFIIRSFDLLWSGLSCTHPIVT